MNIFTNVAAPPLAPSPGERLDSPKRPVLRLGAEDLQAPEPAFGQKWFSALKQIWPVYLAAHLAALLIDGLAVLFTYAKPYPNPRASTPPLSTLWNAWDIWPHDTPHFIEIALHGYDKFWLAAFFPLYPLLIRVASPLTGGNALLAALLVANLAGLLMLMAFYQLVKEDFGEILAQRAVIYFSIFPSAFFLMAGYSETTFFCCVLLCFYELRHGRWWLAGLAGFLAALTRNTGVVLLVPFCYEYLRQRAFAQRGRRWHALSALLIPAGLGLFLLYCACVLGDPLAFQHAENHWHHVLVAPWVGLSYPIHTMWQTISTTQGWLSFVVQRNSIELGTTFFILGLLLLGFFGPWRFPRTHLSYLLFAAIVWLIPLLAPVQPLNGAFPYQSLTRYMLEVFPAFIVLASLGRYRSLHYTYVAVAGVLFCILFTQFLLGYLVI
jgi:Gpi18-like mannosyltransferase